MSKLFIFRSDNLSRLAADLHIGLCHPGANMLVAAKQLSPVVEMKLAETVRRDRELAAAAAKMNAQLSRSLLVSRMLTAFAITACLFVLYVMSNQGKTIGTQQQLIRQLYQDNQRLMQYRIANPPAQSEQQQPQQPAADQPSDGDDAPSASPATQIHLADGCTGGVCA
jgi:hypothetical protein